MKQVSLKLFLSFFTIALFSQSISAQGWWYRKADYNQSSRTAAVAFTAGTGAFVGTGYDSTSFRRNFSVYNPASNAWLQVESMGGVTGSGLSRNAAISFSINNNGYVGLGQGSNPYLNDLWEYNAGGDYWTQKANFGGTPRRSAASFSANNKGYVVCGQDITGFKNDMWMYDPSTNLWTAKAAFPGTARRLPVAFAVGVNAYVGTGDDGVFKGDFFKYSTSSNAWSALPAFAGTPRYGACAFVIGTDGYVGTGYDNTLSNTKTFYKFSTTTNLWSPVKDFSGTARSNAVGFALSGWGYIATGYDSLTTLDLWMYDPLSNGIEETDNFISSVKLYPNPMTEYLNISFDEASLNAFGKISFALYDIHGREVKKIKQFENSEYRIDRGDLANGIYVYRFDADGSLLKAGKIIIQ